MKHYASKGIIGRKGDVKTVNVTDLPINCHLKIEAECVNCHKISLINYVKYNQNVLRQKFYTCKKCGIIKRKNTNLIKYGFEHAIMSEKIIEKRKNTNLIKFGVEYVMMSEEIKKKSKNTNLEKYGVEWASKTQEVKDKIKKTMNEKYGVDYAIQSQEFKEKRAKNNIEKFGYACNLLNADVIKKTEKTMYEKYGVRYSMQSDEIKKKARETLKKYQKNYDEKIFQEYKEKAVKLTKKNKSTLLKNWDGYDHYDGEYIIEFLNLNYWDKNYPTIDHKISIFNAFILGISVEDVSNVKNLCFTKRFINSKKRITKYEDFINELKNEKALK